MRTVIATGLLLAASLGVCQAQTRTDGAEPLVFSYSGDGAGHADGARVSGSLQNPCFSPDGTKLVFTRFTRGYNSAPSDLLVADLTRPNSDGSFPARTLVAGTGVNLPGSAWHPSATFPDGTTGEAIVFSAHDPDNAWMIRPGGALGSEVQVTRQGSRQAWEPVFSPDGRSVLFESHSASGNDAGRIERVETASGRYETLTDPGADCRQPNWSRGTPNLVLYQKRAGGSSFQIFVLSPDHPQVDYQVTSGPESTDASFSPDGTRIIYSSAGAGQNDNLWVATYSDDGTWHGQWSAAPLTSWSGYDGACSWSPTLADGTTRVAFETSPGDPDTSSTTLAWTRVAGSAAALPTPLAPGPPTAPPPGKPAVTRSLVAPPAPSTAPGSIAAKGPVLRQGDSGAEVARLQDALRAAGFDPGPSDGDFGPRTRAAVAAFQGQAGLQTDGVVGPITRAALANAAPAPAPPPPPPPAAPTGPPATPPMPATPPTTPTTGTSSDLPAVRSWAYQLQGADVASLAASRFDLFVIDFSRDGSDAGAYTPVEFSTIQSGGRTVLSYLSIGEAETYRSYWKQGWAKGNPGWMGTENPDWGGNYKVRYWDPRWQQIVFDYLDRVIDAGFDGVYLDIIDAYEYWGPGGESGLDRASAEQEMVDFVAAIAHHARVDRGRPGFFVVPQNGAGLGSHPGYFAVVSGLGKEDTYYNGDAQQGSSGIASDRADLARFTAAGKTVLAIDYVTTRANIDDFYARAAADGLVPYASDRGLDKLTVNPGHDP